MMLDELLSKEEIEKKLPEIKTADELYELVKADISKEDFQAQLQKLYDEAEELPLSEEELNSITAAGLASDGGSCWTPNNGFVTRPPSSFASDGSHVCVLMGGAKCLHWGNDKGDQGWL